MSVTFPKDDSRPGLCKRRRKDGGQCGARAVAGTDACRKHAGIPVEKHRAKGAIVVELRQWGLTGHRDLADPGETLLRLVTQSAARVELYSRLLAEAYEAGERLRAAEEAPELDEDAALTARLDLDRIMNHGGVAALIGYRYASSPTGPMATSEVTRGLADLEAQERDRCAAFAAKAVAAGLAERMVRASEQHAAAMAAAMERTLVRLGHDPADPAVRAAVVEELQAISAGPKTIDGRVAA